MSHAILPPSGAASWGKCPGWVEMNAFYPEDTQSEAALEGTLAHEIAAAFLIGKEWDAHADQDMFDGATMYADDILAVLAEYPTGILMVEETISIARIHGQCWGTFDAAVYVPELFKLFIWDYKYGMNPVDVFENAQMTCYASGLLDKFKCDDLKVSVEFRIIQPRAWHEDGPIRKYGVMAHELRGPINLLSNAAHLALSGGDCNSGKHCQYCDARHACPAAIRAGMSLYEQSCRPVPMELSDENIGALYAILKRAEDQIEYLKTGIETELKARIAQGRIIPNWSMTRMSGKRKWNVSNKELFELGDLLGIDLRAPTEAISPTKLEEKNSPMYSALAQYVSKPLGGTKLVPIDNKKIRRIFQ